MEPTTSIEDFLPLSELFDDDNTETNDLSICMVDFKTTSLHSDAYEIQTCQGYLYGTTIRAAGEYHTFPV